MLVHETVPVQRAVRRELARDPVAFALIYLPHHIRDRAGRITFSEIHYSWAGLAARWTEPVTAPQQHRHAFIAPRETGKSTWWFLILPLWAAAHGHKSFIVAFADASAQAETHLRTFKEELERNPLLRADFPELCEPARKVTGGTLADRAGMIHQKSGLVFAARGMDAKTLGLKVQERRPDLLIFDDIEGDESNYSEPMAEKRLRTVTDAAFPLNIYAAVAMVGTVTMPASIMHQLVRAAQGAEVADWIADEKIQPHHYVPILTNDDGTERSAWPAKWPLEWLKEFEHTRSYQKNYLNDPMGIAGAYWTRDDFQYGSLGPEATRWMLCLDPAVTTKGTSDWTGWAVVACRPGDGERPPSVEVVDAGQVKLMGEPLRMWVLDKLTQYPKIKAVRVEVNQGGELWYTVFHSMPVRLLVHTSSESKEVRFSWALDFYQTGGGRVLHRQELRAAQEQMVAFPRAAHDDIADAVVSGVLYFLRTERKLTASSSASAYV
jgi:phage terminase large subunit-like protein